MNHTNHIEELAKILSKLPSIGNRTAYRIIFDLLKNKDKKMLPLAESLIKCAKNIEDCKICGNISEINPCHICIDAKREQHIICVVENISDLFAIEKSNIFKGKYHVIGGTLSAIDGRNPSSLNIDNLIERVHGEEIKEIIIATNATIEGQTTAYYISDLFKDRDIKISRLAYGIPMGGELQYLDDETLNIAMQMRKLF